MAKFTTKSVLVIFLIVVAISAVGYFAYFKKSGLPDYKFIIAKKSELVQTVSVTGRIKPAQSADLSFEKNGKVIWVGAEIGDKVYSGQTLVRIYSADLLAKLSEAKAEVKAQKAKLDELNKGTRQEEIKIQEIKIENQKTAIEEAKKNLINKLQDAYTKSDDAIRNRIDRYFDDPRTSNPQVSFLIADSQLEIDIEWERFLIESVLISWKDSLDELSVLSDFELYIAAAKQNLAKTKSLLDKCALALNGLNQNSNFSQATIDGYRDNTSTARTNVNTASSSLSSSEEKLKTAESALLLNENELVLLNAGATQEQIAKQEALLEKSEASVQNISAEISKTALLSPINGIITVQDAKAGEIISANTVIVSVISEAKFEVEANIPEADISKIKINDNAEITLDAYGDEIIFTAKVISVDPGETMIDGVATYKTVLRFLEEDNRIKSGMTANIDILTDKRENVIAIPQRVVIERNGEKIVRILDDDVNIVHEVAVKIGIRGSDGRREIMEGIKEGDKVIISIK